MSEINLPDIKAMPSWLWVVGGGGILLFVLLGRQKTTTVVDTSGLLSEELARKQREGWEQVYWYLKGLDIPESTSETGQFSGYDPKQDTILPKKPAFEFSPPIFPPQPKYLEEYESAGGYNPVENKIHDITQDINFSFAGS